MNMIECLGLDFLTEDEETFESLIVFYDVKFKLRG